ncbi:MAG TPA: DUF805 domain-containing protein [Myxococcaceae bacterium]|nr:DUF805 domain-containing protein [Myxococcaceae bacterium]
MVLSVMTQTLRRLSSLLFGLSEPVNRRQYAVAGFSLMAFKYVVDAGIIYASSRTFWTPLAYLTPLESARIEAVGKNTAVAVALAIWTLPFIWIGVSMTFRRAIDAGLPRWFGLLFLVPFVNYLLMLELCLHPSKARPVARAWSPARRPGQIESALIGVGAGLIYTAIVLAVSTYGLGSYGGVLFVGLPVAMGALSGYFFNRYQRQSIKATIGVSLLTSLIAAGAAFIFAVEGLVCILMAAPLLIGGSVLGALVGRALATGAGPPLSTALLVLISVPFLAGFESLGRKRRVFETISAVEIQASAEDVWNQVIEFPPLPPPSQPWFRAGIAYPQSAKIDLRGVGAVRHCNFSTGSFTEPITGWDPPRRLSFDVVSEPPPMRELSPYQIAPPHLNHYFHSVRGEFRIVPLGERRTRLEGSTWYELKFSPSFYWEFWADHLVHAIHLRVLEHIRALSEADSL